MGFSVYGLFGSGAFGYGGFSVYGLFGSPPGGWAGVWEKSESNNYTPTKVEQQK
jgi:hypothetical protein